MLPPLHCLLCCPVVDGGADQMAARRRKTARRHTRHNRGEAEGDSTQMRTVSGWQASGSKAAAVGDARTEQQIRRGGCAG